MYTWKGRAMVGSFDVHPQRPFTPSALSRERERM
jgi:hypothetical protein